MPKNKPYPRPFPASKPARKKTTKKKTTTKKKGSGMMVPSRKKGMTAGKKRKPYGK